MNLQAILDVVLIVSGSVWLFVIGSLAVGLKRVGKRQPASTKPVTFNVLIAARNEEHNILECLQAVADQDYDPNLYKVYVLNDNSTDRTLEIAREFAKGHPNFNVFDISEPSAGIAPKKYALMNGIMEARNEVIITTDADCRPGPGWLSGIAACFDEQTSAVVGYSPLSGEGLAGAVSRFDAFVNGVVSAGSIGLGKPTTAVGRNFAYRKSVFEQAGGFGKGSKGASGDDDLLLQRIASSGQKVRFATDVACHVPAKGSESLRRWLRMKRRHYSAGGRYKPGFVLLSGLLYLLNLGLVVALTGVLAGRISWYIPTLALGAKLLVDHAALATGGSILGEKRWQGAWLIAELLSPILITLLLPLSLFGKVSWKERKLER